MERTRYSEKRKRQASQKGAGGKQRRGEGPPLLTNKLVEEKSKGGRGKASLNRIRNMIKRIVAT